jgi:hypothetical protein
VLRRFTQNFTRNFFVSNNPQLGLYTSFSWSAPVQRSNKYFDFLSLYNWTFYMSIIRTIYETLKDDNGLNQIVKSNNGGFWLEWKRMGIYDFPLSPDQADHFVCAFAFKLYIGFKWNNFFIFIGKPYVNRCPTISTIIWSKSALFTNSEPI